MSMLLSHVPLHKAYGVQGAGEDKERQGVWEEMSGSWKIFWGAVRRLRLLLAAAGTVASAALLSQAISTNNYVAMEYLAWDWAVKTADSVFMVIRIN